MGNKKQTETKKLEELKNWFVNNPKLPQEIDDQLLKRFLKCMHWNIEETKQLIEHNYALRNKNPHIFIERDPHDDCLQEFHELHDIIPLPGLTPQKHRILFFRLNECEPSKMNSVLESKVFFMMADCRFTMLDIDVDSQEKQNREADEDEHIDIETEMAEDLKFLQEAYPVRLRAMHIINCPSYLDKMIAIMRPFIRDEVYNMTHFHTNGLESVYEHIPRDMLPNEYGGKAGTIPELKANWAKILAQKRPYLMDPKYWKVEKTPSRWSWW